MSKSLLTSWPDAALRTSARHIFGLVEQLSLIRPDDYYYRTCGLLRGSQAPASALEEKLNAALAETVLELRENNAATWLQSIASLLGMLMHFTHRETAGLVNRRRPGKPFATYPNSPATTALVVKPLLRHWLARSDAESCEPRQTLRAAERILTVRILDPTMESGQLLLACALEVRDWVARRSLESDRIRLTQEILKRLCAKCLFGIDRNGEAIEATRTVFALLADAVGLKDLPLPGVRCADSLQLFLEGSLGTYQAVVNNPPWGQPEMTGERKRLAKFDTTEHNKDTYIAFCELALKTLETGGIFSLVIPSQFVAARNAQELRRLLSQHSRLDQLTVLPRSAFSDATVRGLHVLGRKCHDSVPDRRCRVTIYPLVKRKDVRQPPRIQSVSNGALARCKGSSWAPAILRQPRAPEGAVPLGRLVRFYSGVQLYGRGMGAPPQTRETVERRPFSSRRPQPGSVPAIRGKDVRRFHLQEPSEHILLGPWLARQGCHRNLIDAERVFLRELCRRDGQLTAALARCGVLPLHGVITLIPSGIDPSLLLALLNSRTTAGFVATSAASFSKVDFQRITIHELKRLPVPSRLIQGHEPRQAEEHNELIRLSRLAAVGNVTGEIDAWLNQLVASCYAAGGDHGGI